MMATNPTPQITDFTRDVIGRFVCNGLDEAISSTNLPEGRPFDIIVIGGGTFGSVIAQHLFYRDKTRSHRILVLEGGPLVLPEHVQNLPMMGLNVPGPSSIADLRSTGQDRLPRNEVWGLAWHSDVKFPGLSYCVGGRSVFWGGWSPQLLDSEMAQTRWPLSVVTELKDRYFDRAAEQIGVKETNDFIHGALHTALRQQLFDGLQSGGVTDAIPLDELADPYISPTISREELVDHLGLTGTGAPSLDRPELLKMLNLEAPLAVQTRAPRAGLFPFNKFSAVPVLMKAARAAYLESGGDDRKKRLMVVPHCHVTRLTTRVAPDSTQHVTGVQTNLGEIPVQENGTVIIALATIESTRLALLSFGGIPNYDLIGKNLMAHLRSNLTIRIPRESLTFLDENIRELQASALFVKGRHRFSDGGEGHFHLQITASGLGSVGTDSEAELFKKVPDIDGFDAFRAASDSHVVITIRGIGEMEPQNPNSSVTLDPEPDEFGTSRAFVRLAPSARDLKLWDVMDKAADDVAKVFAGGRKYDVLGKGQDKLGTTHHETGTLWMGDDSTKSVTNADGRFHHVSNAYVVGPALFPTVGSPNPMLTGVALARRTADRLTPPPPPPQDGFAYLFDGTEETFRHWQFVGQGKVELLDGAIVVKPGNDLGLFYFTQRTFGNFTLRLQFRVENINCNSGVFVRFQDPRREVPDRSDPTKSYPYDNPAWVAVHTGFEAQIDDLARPDGIDYHRTGAIYNAPIGSNPGEQAYRRPERLIPGKWHEYEISVEDDTYRVKLDGQSTATFTNTDGFRGKSKASGYVGIQAHTGRVEFRNVTVLAEVPAAGKIRVRTEVGVVSG